MRSWLTVAPEKERLLEKAATAGADVVVIDLARAMTEERKVPVRLAAREWLSSHSEHVVAARYFRRWVRIGPVRAPNWRDDLEAALEARIDGVILAECSGEDDIRQLASYLYESEGRFGIASNAVPIVPELGSSPRAVLNLDALIGAIHPRVSALAWDAVGLARAIDARRLRGPGGLWIDPLAMLRAKVLLIAHASGLGVLEAAYTGAKEEDIARFSAAARADGFTGMFAVRREQVDPINEAFSASDEQRAEAREIAGVFSLNPSATMVPFRGRWIGQHELAAARALLD